MENRIFRLEEGSQMLKILFVNSKIKSTGYQMNHLLSAIHFITHNL